LGIDIDVVGVQYLRVVEGLEDRRLEYVGEEGVLVGRLVAADEGLKALLLTQHPLEQAHVGLANVDAAGHVDGLVERKLHALDQVEGDCVLEAAGLQLALERKLGLVRTSKGRDAYMSWKRMLARSRAFEASERSMAASMVVWPGARGPDVG